MQHGTVININLERGFGFIKPRGDNVNVFFHLNDLNGLEFDAALEQREVCFQLGTDQRSGRVRAYDVRPAR